MNFKERDIEGESTLKAISRAHKFNYWMYQQMSPYLKGDVLEIGSGIGNISMYIETDGNIVLSDLRQNYINILKQSFPQREIVKIDLVHPNFESCYANLIGRFDFVFALNVVEHILDDKMALQNINKLLKQDGKMFILVPAYQWLYNQFDVALEHFRRYTKSSLHKIIPDSMQIEKSWYFNSIGIFGWFFVGKLLGKKTIPEGNMKFYNKIIPLVKTMDFLIGRKIGLSVIVVCHKK